MEKKVIRVGLLGLGTVGQGVMNLLDSNRAAIEKKIGAAIEVAAILVRDPAKPRDVNVPAALFTTNPQDILAHPDIHIVVEVIGGTEPAKEYVLAALQAGQSVVTANKDLLALHGAELFAAAGASGADLLFEASVGGGIPVIHPLKECLAGNHLTEVMGIVNGTTNYILSKMAAAEHDLDTALAEAQQLGYAEADTSADIGGDDAARKVAILASIAFNTRVTYPDVYVEGISRITREDIIYAAELGYVIKLLGIARDRDGEIEVRVHPAFLPHHHPLATVNGVYNAIFVRGDGIGEVMFYGQGAGGLPTGSAVLGDIIDAARNIVHGSQGRVQCTCYYTKPIRAIGQLTCKYYLRLTVKDRPGVLASIAGVFGNQGVSIASVIQKRTLDGLAELVLVTHQVQEENFQDALKIIGGLSSVSSIDNAIRVEGSPE